MKKIATNVAVGVAAGLLVLAGGAAGNAAPYVTSGSVAVSNTAPCAGRAITVQVSGFTPGETVDIFLGTATTPAASIVAGTTGGGAIDITIPAADLGPLTVSAVGETSGLTAFAALSVLDCTGAGGGIHNAGDGNEGANNIGDGNQGDRNRGDGNEGSGNIGNGNQSDDNIGDGNSALVEHDNAISNTSAGDHDSLAVWVGIGAAAAVSVVRRGRRRA